MAASEGVKNLSQEQNSCIFLPAGIDSPHCESHTVTEVLMLKLPILLRARKGGQYTVNCACHCLAFYLHLGLHLSSAKWGFAVEFPSSRPLRAHCCVCDAYTAKVLHFRGRLSWYSHWAGGSGAWSCSWVDSPLSSKV